MEVTTMSANSSARKPKSRDGQWKPALELLEHRCLLSYTITDLGTLGGKLSEGHALNDSGHVTGLAVQANGVDSAFAFENGSMTDLDSRMRLASVGEAVNASGVVAGSAWIRTPAGTVKRAAVFDGIGGFTQVGSLGGITSEGAAINDAGQVAGSAATSSGMVHGFVTNTSGGTIDLGGLAPFGSQAFGMNNLGQVVGQSEAIDGNMHAFRWQDGAMADLGIGTAYDINNQGQTVGVNQLSQPVIFGEGLLAAGAGAAVAINDLGQAVGYQFIVGGGGQVFATLFANGEVVDLNNEIPSGSGWVLGQATGINNQGQIVGTGMSPNGLEHAFLLTPAGDSPIDSRLVTASAGELRIVMYVSDSSNRSAAKATIPLQEFGVIDRPSRTTAPRSHASKGADSADPLVSQDPLLFYNSPPNRSAFSINPNYE
jgi:probable HAF family extracellular repeat protein